MTILVTGAAGFIGAYVCRALQARGDAVVGLDNFNDYYEPQLKRDRVAALCPDVEIDALDLTDGAGMAALFDAVAPTRVIHLAAQAGVRYSLSNPHAYVDSNLIGFLNMLGAVPASRRRAPGLCQFVVGVRRFGDAAVLRGRSASTSRVRSTPRPRPRTN